MNLFAITSLPTVTCEQDFGNGDCILATPHYNVLVNGAGNVRIADKKNAPIITSLGWYQEYAENSQRQIEAHLKLVNTVVTETDTGKTLTINGSTAISNLTISFHFHRDSHTIDASVSTIYHKAVSLYRESLILRFADAVQEIYQKNRKRQADNFSEEYWLGTQGVRIGEGDRCLLMYHTPHLSSLQLNVRKKQLWLNLDFHEDHPHIGDDPNGTWLDRSAAIFQPGDHRNNFFSFSVGLDPQLFPRLMANPEGRLATYVYTEHACFTDFRIHKAVYYGSERIDSPEKATGGFVKHGIPVTKSVFYANACCEKNDSQSKIFTGDMVSLTNNTNFLQFITHLHQLGHEICLHCVQPQTSSLSLAEEGIKFMKERFDMVSWIDHLEFRQSGFTSGCHEAFSFKSLEKDSKVFMKPLWEKYGVNYFWNPAPEYMRYNQFRPSVKQMITKLQFFQLMRELTERKQKKGTLSAEYQSLDLLTKPTSLPDPLYWRHPTVTFDFISWATLCPKRFDKDDETHSDSALQELLDNWGVCLNHAYPTYIGENNGAYRITDNGEVVVSNEFDEALKRLAALRERGDLHITTIRELLGFWIQCEKIKFEYLPDGQGVNIHNLGNTPILGVSFANHGGNVLVNGEPPASRRSGHDFIFWCDLPAHGHVRVSFSA